MQIEQNYQFRDAIRQIHAPNLRDFSLTKNEDELIIDELWSISIPENSPEVVRNAAKDLQDYFLVSMNVNVKIENAKDNVIKLIADDSNYGKGEFSLVVKSNSIEIRGGNGAGLFAGIVRLEDICSMREAPFVKITEERFKKLVYPRIVHSGFGGDLFPNEELARIVHAGFDGIVVFVRENDVVANSGYCDINDVIHRAEAFGLMTVLYSYLPAYKHPADSDAREYFENIYTNLFKYYPKAAGVMLVGESAQFPSKDPLTTGKTASESVIDGIPDNRPFPGWYPCEDYPDWIRLVRDAVRKASPDAMIIFSTYNWGYVDENLRKKFLEKVPKDVIVQITFEIFKKVKRENLVCNVMDYTISEYEPGEYFTSEAENAHKLGLQLLATANTAGRTWDFGTAPYVPVPQQWMRKFKALDNARKNWGVSRYYDNHHYGWDPSIITDLGREYFRSPQVDLDELFDKLLVRDYGKVAAPMMKAAYEKWSEAVSYFTPTNEDQYGPLRTGPSYPLISHPNITRVMSNKEIQFPTDKNAFFGHNIIKTFYQPFENNRQAPGSLRHPVELRSLKKGLAIWEEGIELMQKAMNDIPERKLFKAERELNIGRFIKHSIITAINVKTWYGLNIKLLAADEKDELIKLIDKLENLAKAEIQNAKETIPVVECDSRLGFEPSMHYVCDKWHLEWKIRQVENTINSDLAEFKKIVNLSY